MEQWYNQLVDHFTNLNIPKGGKTITVKSPKLNPGVAKFMYDGFNGKPSIIRVIRDKYKKRLRGLKVISYQDIVGIYTKNGLKYFVLVYVKLSWKKIKN